MRVSVVRMHQLGMAGKPADRGRGQQICVQPGATRHFQAAPARQQRDAMSGLRESLRQSQRLPLAASHRNTGIYVKKVHKGKSKVKVQKSKVSRSAVYAFFV